MIQKPCFALGSNLNTTAIQPILNPIKTWEAHGYLSGGLLARLQGGGGRFDADIFVEAELVSRFGKQRLAGDKLPFRRFKRGKVDIAFKLSLDAGEEDFGNQRHEKRENLRAACDEAFLILVAVAEAFLHAVADRGSGSLEIHVPREHQVQTTRQCSLEAQPGVFAHHDGVPQGLFLEETKVFGNMPGQGAFLPDEHISIHGDDDG